MSSPPSQPEQFGRYTVHAMIGEGAMGRVYRAFDPLAHRDVAVKTLKAEYLTTDTRDEFLRRFRREAQAAGSLSHPNIITIFDVGENFFVMEMLAGASLQEILERRGRLELAEVLRLLGPVAEALDYAHSKGTIHRDIKPGNIMVLPDGRPKLMDFGVAHLASTVLTATGQFLGSPGYMAPEQIVNGEASPRTDLFALAVVSYELLTGKRPFQGDNITTVIYKVVNETPPSPRHWNVDLPARYDEIFARALAKDPALRYENASAFVAALNLKDFESALASAFPTTPAPVAAAPAALQHVDAPTGPVQRPEPDVVETMDLKTVAPVPRRVRGRTWGLLAMLALVAGGFAVLDQPTLLAPIATWLPTWFPTPVATPVAVPTPVVTPMAALPTTVVSAADPSLRIEADPEGSTVWLDDIERGPAPVVLDAITPGSHTVRVVCDGFAPAQLSLEVVAGMTLAPLRFVLQPTSAVLQLSSQPTGATVSLDGKPSGTTPLEGVLLQPGPHELRVERKGFRSWSRKVKARAGETLTLAAQLERGVVARPVATPSPSPALREGDLVEMGPDVTPPQRLTNEAVSYPEAARRLRLQGVVAVDMIVTEAGVPTDVRVIESAGEILDRAVVESVQRWQFEPARKQGVKVRVHWPVRQRFELAR